MTEVERFQQVLQDIFIIQHFSWKKKEVSFYHIKVSNFQNFLTELLPLFDSGIILE